MTAMRAKQKEQVELKHLFQQLTEIALCDKQSLLEMTGTAFESLAHGVDGVNLILNYKLLVRLINLVTEHQKLIRNEYDKLKDLPDLYENAINYQKLAPFE